MKKRPDLASLVGGEAYLSLVEASEVLGIHVTTLRNWIKAGYGPPFKRFGNRTLRVSASDLKNWYDSKTYGDHDG